MVISIKVPLYETLNSQPISNAILFLCQFPSCYISTVLKISQRYVAIISVGNSNPFIHDGFIFNTDLLHTVRRPIVVCWKL